MKIVPSNKVLHTANRLIVLDQSVLLLYGSSRSVSSDIVTSDMVVVGRIVVGHRNENQKKV